MLILLLVAALHLSVQAAPREQPLITVTKAIQISGTEFRLATGSLLVTLNSSLPPLDFRFDDSIVNCSGMALDLDNFRTLCESMDKVHEASVNLLEEIRIVALRTGSARKVRSLLPILGKINSWITGTATEGELDTVVDKLNELGHDLDSVKSSVSNAVQAVNNQSIELSGLSKAVNKRFQELADAFNSLNSVCAHYTMVTTHMMAKMISSMFLHSKIQILTSHVLELKQIKQDCMVGKLPRALIPRSAILNIIAQETPVLLAAKLKLLFNENEIENYFDLYTSTCVFINDTFIVHTRLPLTPSRTDWRIVKVRPTAFLLDSDTCTLFETDQLAATDGESDPPTCSVRFIFFFPDDFLCTSAP